MSLNEVSSLWEIELGLAVSRHVRRVELPCFFHNFHQVRLFQSCHLQVTSIPHFIRSGMMIELRLCWSRTPLDLRRTEWWSSEINEALLVRFHEALNYVVLLFLLIPRPNILDHESILGHPFLRIVLLSELWEWESFGIKIVEIELTVWSSWCFQSFILCLWLRIHRLMQLIGLRPSSCLNRGSF